MPLDPHSIEKILATIADVTMFVGAALLAVEAFRRELDAKEVQEGLKALGDPSLANLVFVKRGVVIKPNDPEKEKKLEVVNIRRNKTALTWGIWLTAGGFAVHILSLWVV